MSTDLKRPDRKQGVSARASRMRQRRDEGMTVRLPSQTLTAWAIIGAIALLIFLILSGVT